MAGDVNEGLRESSRLRGAEELFASALKPLIRRIAFGGLNVVTPSGGRIVHHGANAGPEASIVLHNWRPVRRILLGGDVAFAESYMNGDWTTPDLTAVIELAARNADTLDNAIGGGPIVRTLNRMRHALRANTKRGSRRNIEAHYDLGNDFYSLWLDESMTYSSAIYSAGAQESLEEAQSRKIARVCDMLDVGEGSSVLEIGCGWGAQGRALAQRGARVTGLTLSPSQLEWARRVGEEGGLSANLDLRLQDYRDVRGAFDRIVSIEMIEAVGERYWPDYFGAIAARMKEDGCAVLQAITIADDRFEAYRKGADFIQRYVFPGGMLPSRETLERSVAQAGLRIVESETFADSYAATLAEWRHRMLLAWPQIAAQGFEPRFRRLWEYYLCYCEAGFRARTIDVGLYKLAHAR
ncbi:MAG: cyclopropane-fatty-acyl-phospholipid synthase family protein [Beijerinckiaceae bacterium]|nr:cyclopropane-fatty-acyl-phospholipid synthase family protein [Beijerinckiaceae bacterium]